MERICSHKQVSKVITTDPVRPHISAESRLLPARDIFHLDHQAYICLVYIDRVPADEECLLSANCGPVALAYTVWSLQKGMGREIIFRTRDMIQ